MRNVLHDFDYLQYFHVIPASAGMLDPHLTHAQSCSDPSLLDRVGAVEAPRHWAGGDAPRAQRLPQRLLQPSPDACQRRGPPPSASMYSPFTASHKLKCRGMCFKVIKYNISVCVTDLISYVFSGRRLIFDLVTTYTIDDFILEPFFISIKKLG